MPPVAPENAVFNQGVFAVCSHVSVAFHADAIVVSTDKTVGNARVAAVLHIHAVGIIPPATYYFDVFAREAVHVDRRNVIAKRIAQDRSVYRDVTAVADRNEVLSFRVHHVLLSVARFDVEQNFLF